MNTIQSNIQEFKKLDLYMNCCVYCKKETVEKYPTVHCSLKCKFLDSFKQNKNNECWNWHKGNGGVYGKVLWKKKHHSAHRVSYEIFKGPIPSGLVICHKCDNPRCVNPDHLFAGTYKDNAQDSIAKGRTNCKGIKNAFAKFTDEQIKEMILLKKEGFTYKRLAKIFNCSITYLLKINKNGGR